MYSHRARRAVHLQRRAAILALGEGEHPPFVFRAHGVAMPAREVLARLAHAARAQRGLQPGARARSEEGAVQRGGQSRLLRHPRRERGVRAGGGGARAAQVAQRRPARPKGSVVVASAGGGGDGHGARLGGVAAALQVEQRDEGARLGPRRCLPGVPTVATCGLLGGSAARREVRDGSKPIDGRWRERVRAGGQVT
eukprot:scaffold6327_cov61-Phaeocystis_antarctica.AAC.9